MIIKAVKLEIMYMDDKEETNKDELKKQIKKKLNADYVRVNDVKTFVLGDKE